MTKKNSCFLKLAATTTVVVAGLLAGCATTAPKATFSQLPTVHLASNDETKVAISTEGATMYDYEKSRLAQEIAASIRAKQDRGLLPNPAAKSYEVDVNITRYDKGNAFARAMLAGLGQIHINATVSLFEQPAHTRVCQFDLNKTFAWGGIYGASTSMEDVEKGFAEGVAAALTGQPEETPAKSSATGKTAEAPGKSPQS